MNTHSQKRQNDDVGGTHRPRAHVNRPRGLTLCVGVPKGGPPTTSTSTQTWAIGDEAKPPTSLAQYGGQHRSPPVTETRNDERLALAWFNAELALYAGQA